MVRPGENVDRGRPLGRALERWSSHIAWSVAGLLLFGTVAAHFGAGRSPELVGLAEVAGLAWGYRNAGRRPRSDTH